MCFVAFGKKKYVRVDRTYVKNNFCHTKDCRNASGEPLRTSNFNLLKLGNTKMI